MMGAPDLADLAAQGTLPGDRRDLPRRPMEVLSRNEEAPSADTERAGKSGQLVAHDSIANAGRTSPRQAARLDFEVLDGADLATPLPPAVYLVDALGIAMGGAPTIVGGYGGSCKTMFVQSLALSVATGTDFLGVYRVHKGAALHVDFEQGRGLTQTRYQRLARSMGVGLANIGQALQLVTLPSLYLDGERGLEALRRAAEGKQLLVIDSIRAAFPTADENSSDIRRFLDPLTALSEQLGLATVLLHHANKPKADSAGGKYSLRGSGAIFDACASVFVLSGDKGKPVRVSHEKDRNRGALVSDFGLLPKDVELAGENRAGLQLAHLEPEQVAEAYAEGQGCTEGDETRILGVVARAGGCFVGGKTKLASAAGGKRQRVLTTIGELVGRGQLVETADGLTLAPTG